VIVDQYMEGDHGGRQENEAKPTEAEEESRDSAFERKEKDEQGRDGDGRQEGRQLKGRGRLSELLVNAEICRHDDRRNIMDKPFCLGRHL
jgi:hypothetical protein